MWKGNRTLGPLLVCVGRRISSHSHERNFSKLLPSASIPSHRIDRQTGRQACPQSVRINKERRLSRWKLTYYTDLLLSFSQWVWDMGQSMSYNFNGCFMLLKKLHFHFEINLRLLLITNVQFYYISLNNGHIKLIENDSIYVKKDLYFKYILFFWTCFYSLKNIDIFSWAPNQH